MTTSQVGLRGATLSLLLACGSCNSETASEKAMRNHNFIEGRATPDELCEAKRKVQQAYREEQNAKEYELWKLYADVACTRAEQIRAIGF